MSFIEVRKTAADGVSDGFVCVKYNAMLHFAVSKASSNFTREEYRQLLRLKRRGVSPTRPYGGLLVTGIDVITYFRSVANRINVFILSHILVAISRYRVNQLKQKAHQLVGQAKRRATKI